MHPVWGICFSTHQIKNENPNLPDCGSDDKFDVYSHLIFLFGQAESTKKWIYTYFLYGTTFKTDGQLPA